MFADLDEASAGEEVATRGFTAAAVVVEATGAERGASGEAFAVVEASKPDESGCLAGSGSMTGGMEVVVVTASVPRAAFRLMEPVTEFESLFERGDTGKQPVAITVQCIDSGRKSSYFLLGRFRNLQMRRLLCEIGGDDLVGPDTGTGIVSQESNDYGPD